MFGSITQEHFQKYRLAFVWCYFSKTYNEIDIFWNSNRPENAINEIVHFCSLLAVIEIFDFVRKRTGQNFTWPLFENLKSTDMWVLAKN